MTKKRTMQIPSAADCFIMRRLPADVIKQLTAAELKVLLHGAGGASCEPTRLAEELGITADEAEAALVTLEGLAIVSLKEEKNKKNKSHINAQYDSEELADAIDVNDSFKIVVEFATEKLQKQLNRNDLNTLFSMYDFYGMSSEFICGVIDYCVSVNKYSLAYIFNTAVSMQADGVNSYESLQEHLKEKRATDSKASRFRRLCGWGSRELTVKERNYTERWFGEMGLSFELVKHAYEITVNNTGEVALPYMSKLLEKWHAAGIKTPAEVEKQQREKPKQKKSGGGYDAEVEQLLRSAAEKGYIKPKKEN